MRIETVISVLIISAIIIFSTGITVIYINLNYEYNKLILKYSLLKEKALKLNSTLLTLQQTYNELTKNYEALNIEHSKLEKEFSNLKVNYVALNSKYVSLQKLYQTLLSNYQTLQAKYSQLAGKYENLQYKYSEIVTEALFPPYTVISNRTIKWVFKTSYGELTEWSMPIDTYRSIVTQPEPVSYLNLYNSETGETYRVRDYTLFVESESFSKVIPDLYYEMEQKLILPRPYEEQLVHEIWHIVSQLTVYSPDIGDDPRWALETLTEAGGDCEDLAILAASMLKAAPVNYEVYLVYMDTDNPEHPEKVNHVIVYVKYGEYSTFVEATNKHVMNPYASVKGWYYKV